MHIRRYDGEWLYLSSGSDLCTFYSGEETRVIPRILGLRSQWKRNKKESTRLEEAGVTDEVLNAAISAFIIEVRVYGLLK